MRELHHWKLSKLSYPLLRVTVPEFSLMHVDVSRAYSLAKAQRVGSFESAGRRLLKKGQRENRTA